MRTKSLTHIDRRIARLLLVMMLAATLVPAWKVQAGGLHPPAAQVPQGADEKMAGGWRAQPGAAINPPGLWAAASSTRVYLPMVSGPSGVKSGHFSLLPPGSKLPGDAECAAAVKPKPENKRVNRTYNATTGKGQKLAGDEIFSGDDPRASKEMAPRVTGNFTGTTDEILQWAACKWGIDEDMVRAQAAKESWWRQDAKGDWSTNAAVCPPGHGLGVDGKPGMCPESWGILQNRYIYEKSAWPGIQASTAFNADTAYAIWRVCYEGYTWWLNQVDRGSEYKKGDAWGCMGVWFAGRWDTKEARQYISDVKAYHQQRVWEAASFQEP